MCFGSFSRICEGGRKDDFCQVAYAVALVNPAASLELLSLGGFFEADLEMEMRLSFLHNSNMEIERENFIFWIMLNMIKNHVFHHVIS